MTASEPQHAPVEGQFLGELINDRRRLAEAVTLPFVGVVLVLDALSGQGIDDRLALGGWDDAVVEPLEHDQWRVEQVEVVDRRALLVPLA